MRLHIAARRFGSRIRIRLMAEQLLLDSWCACTVGCIAHAGFCVACRCRLTNAFRIFLNLCPNAGFTFSSPTRGWRWTSTRTEP